MMIVNSSFTFPTLLPLCVWLTRWLSNSMPCFTYMRKQFCPAVKCVLAHIASLVGMLFHSVLVKQRKGL